MSVAGSGEPGYNQNTNHPVSSETPGLTVQLPGDLQKLQLLLSVLPVGSCVAGYSDVFWSIDGVEGSSGW